MGSKKSKSTTKVILDPQTQQINQMIIDQNEQLAPLRAMGRAEADKVLNPTNQLPTGLMRSPYTMSTGEVLPGLDAAALYANSPGLSGMNFASPEEAFAASRMAGLTDVSGLQNSARTTLDKVIAPQLLSKAIAMGMGRSGAPLDALAQAGAQFALPIEQARMGAESNLAQYISSLGQRRQNMGVSLAASPINAGGFTQAPQSTTTTTQPSNLFGTLLGIGGSILGGPIGGAIGGGIGSMFGGGSSGGGGTSSIMNNGYNFGLNY